jgi:hypothetical protein
MLKEQNMSNDWMPGAQSKFAVWSQQFISGIEEKKAELNLSTAVITALNAKQTAFMEKWTMLIEQPNSTARNAAKKDLIYAHKAYIRGWFNKTLRYSDELTNEIRGYCGLPIRKGKNGHNAMDGYRLGFELYPNGPFCVGMRCWDEATLEKKVLPNMNGIMVRYAISDKPITNIAQLSQAVAVSKMRYLFKAADTQRGQWLSVTCCWQSKTCVEGQCSPIQSAVIP